MNGRVNGGDSWQDFSVNTADASIPLFRKNDSVNKDIHLAQFLRVNPGMTDQKFRKGGIYLQKKNRNVSSLDDSFGVNGFGGA